MQHTAEIDERRVFLATVLADGVISKHDYCWYEKDKIQERSRIAGVFFFLIAKAALTIIYWRGKRVLCREPLPSFAGRQAAQRSSSRRQRSPVLQWPVGNNLAADACAHASRQLRVCRPPAQKCTCCNCSRYRQEMFLFWRICSSCVSFSWSRRSARLS